MVIKRNRFGGLAVGTLVLNTCFLLACAVGEETPLPLAAGGSGQSSGSAGSATSGAAHGGSTGTAGASAGGASAGTASGGGTSGGGKGGEGSSGGGIATGRCGRRNANGRTVIARRFGRDGAGNSARYGAAQQCDHEEGDEPGARWPDMDNSRLRLEGRGDAGRVNH
jgi:hypothetical protein